MSKWKVVGFQSLEPTGFEREVRGSKAKVSLLLERLATLHLTEDEVVEATFGVRTDLELHWDHSAKTLCTIGTDYHYIARLEIPDAARS